MPHLGLEPYLQLYSTHLTWLFSSLNTSKASKRQMLTAFLLFNQIVNRLNWQWIQVLSLQKRLMFMSAVFHLGCGSWRFLLKVGPATKLLLHTAETATTSSPPVVLSLNLPSSLSTQHSMPLTLYLYVFRVYLNKHGVVLVAFYQTGCSALIVSMVWQCMSPLCSCSTLTLLAPFKVAGPCSVLSILVNISR